MPTSAQLLIHPIRDVTVVTFNQTSIIDTAQVERIGEQLYELVDNQARRRIILDFAKVSSLSSSALGILIKLQNKADRIDGKVVLCGLRKELRRVFKISKLEKLFTFCADEEKGLATFGVTTAG